MLDLNNWELIGLAIDVAVVYLLNRFYRRKVKDADLVNSIPTYEVGDELRSAIINSSDKSLAYVCVSGLTKSSGTPIKSHYNDAVGVIQHQLYVEHKSKRTQGFWTDVKRVIKDQTNVRPFLLVPTDGDSSVAVEVADALSAEYLLDSLDVVHDHYQPATDSFLSRGLDRLFGEITKGYQETESMLKVGVPLLGIGKLVHDGGKNLLLGPPDDGRRYILTTATKPELVRSMRSDARMLYIARWVFLMAGSAAVIYILYRNILRYKSRLESRRLLDELRLRRQAEARSSSRNSSQQDVSSSATRNCVVCLSEPREVVLLECGHICLCAQCATALPTPKLCPVCRASVARILPTFIS
jgi:E3 ubiquitin-protein ligase MUL1